MNWKIVLAAAAALSLNGCSMYKLEELRHTAPAGTPFQSELSRLYMDYSETAEKDYDWFNSWHFADKGLMLAYGKDAGPEDLNDWDIPASVRPELEKARASLMAVLTPDVERVEPSKAADAQFYFDCWVKEQEQNWREDAIANCRDNLAIVLSQLNAPGVPHVSISQVPAEAVPEAVAEVPSEAPVQEAVKPKKVTKPAAVKKPKEVKVETDSKDAKESIPESASYAVFFESDKAEISEPGMNVITEVIKSLHGVDDYSVILHNNKEHPGKAAERIQLIKKLLVAGGIKESSIHIATGRTEVESGKSATHRVEIFLNE